jgi:hypothetical protein
MRTLIAAALLAFGAPAFAQEQPAAPAPDYESDGAWLCLPGRDDPCSAPLGTAALNANGYGSVGQARPNPEAPIDCFYVYPTVSRDPGLNSDLNAGPEEQRAATMQFARFTSVCRPFAPIYRSMTLASLGRFLAGGIDPTPNINIAYEDVRAAWRQFLSRRNQGRPFVIVGHSQGTMHLIRLLREEIEGSDAARRMLSAMLIGFLVEVPEGQLVGGSFRQTPLCTRIGETGCVVTYSAFRATNPPPADAAFGRAAGQGMTAACTNPATLRSGSAPLDSYWPTTVPAQGQEPIVWSSQGAPPTPFVRTEGLVSASCVNRGRFGYLSVMVNADPSDARTDRIPGDVALFGRIAPGWGMHVADVPLAQGDLIRLIEEQTRAFSRRRR